MKVPSLQSIRNYACHTLGLRTFLDQPGDGPTQPEIPAAGLSWALLLGGILRLVSANRLEWLANFGRRTDLGLTRTFGDDALAYFTERVNPEVIRHRAAETLKLAKYNKVFEEAAFIGLAIDGTGAGHTTKTPCPLCHPLKDSNGKVTGHNHYVVMIGVVGAGITLPFDVEPYAPADSEYAAGKRLLQRAVSHLGPRFANYQLSLPIIARLKQNLPELAAAVETRFSQQQPTDTFLHGEDRIEVWDANGFDPWSTLDWPTVRAMRYRQHKKNGTIIQAEWITNFSIAKLPARRVLQTGQEPLENRESGIQ